MTTPTPRTDSFASSRYDDRPPEWIGFARELEQELDAARCELETAHAISRHETQKLVGMVHEQAVQEKLNAELERENAALAADRDKWLIMAGDLADLLRSTHEIIAPSSYAKEKLSQYDAGAAARDAARDAQSADLLALAPLPVEKTQEKLSAELERELATMTEAAKQAVMERDYHRARAKELETLLVKTIKTPPSFPC